MIHPSQPLDIPAARAIVDAATPPPWKAELDVFDHGVDAEIMAVIVDGPPITLLAEIGTGQLSYQEGEPREAGDARWLKAKDSQALKDARFIAEARTLLPEALTALEEERAEVERWRNAANCMLALALGLADRDLGDPQTDPKEAVILFNEAIDAFVRERIRAAAPAKVEGER